MSVNSRYVELLSDLLWKGGHVPARNHATLRVRNWSGTFHEFPLVTLRKTAWKKALREMQWFMGGDLVCPPELRDWWAGQLDNLNQLVDGYSWQMRSSPTSANVHFDQVAHLLRELKVNPHSRRLVMTTWNPGDMALITKVNANPSTPACCHGTTVQLFVEGDTLHMAHYQRSADVLLGLPHNLVQYWALLMYFAHHAGLAVGSLHYMVGDAHLYTEESHLLTARALVSTEIGTVYDHDYTGLQLAYNYSGGVDCAGVPTFLASDFSVAGTVPAPVVDIKPRLL